jgi:hypothetical protein
MVWFFKRGVTINVFSNAITTLNFKALVSLPL